MQYRFVDLVRTRLAQLTFLNLTNVQRATPNFLKIRKLLRVRRFLLLFVASPMCGSVVGRVSEARSGKQEDYRKG